jgi:hypothetical protein
VDMSIRCYVLPPSVDDGTGRQLIGDQRFERINRGMRSPGRNFAPQASTTLEVVSTVLFCLFFLRASHAISTIHPASGRCLVTTWKSA